MSTRNSHIGIKNQAETGVLELYFLDTIYNRIEIDWVEWTWKEIRLVEDTITKVKAANPSTIKVIIDSDGGSVKIGLALYNFLKHYQASVEVQIIGYAASIASVIACAADKGKLYIARNAFMMIHQATISDVWGNSTDLRNVADMLDAHNDQIIDVYVQRTGMKADEIKDLWKSSDYWMSGELAIKMGFADDYLPENDQFNIAARLQTTGMYKDNIPESLKMLLKAENADSEADEDSETQFKTIFQNLLMKFPEKLKAAIDNFRNKKIDNKAENLAEAVANEIADPLAQAVGEMQNEVEEEIKNAVQASEEKTGKLIKDLSDKLELIANENKGLKEKVETLENENKDLKDKFAENEGGESTTNESGKNEITGFSFAKLS